MARENKKEEMSIVKKEENLAVIAVEEQLLGLFLTLESDDFGICIDKLNPQCFFDERNRKVFTAIRELQREKYSKTFDTALVLSKLKEMNVSDVDFEYLASLANGCNAFLHNLDDYCNQLTNFYKKRQLLKTLVNVEKLTMDSQDANDIISYAEVAIRDINNTNIDSNLVSAGEAAKEHWNKILNDSQHGIKRGFQTGFSYLDRMTDGLKGGQLIVLAARPGCGKTAFSLNIVANTISLNTKAVYKKEKKKGVIIFNLEMTKEELINRFWSMLGKIPNEQIRGYMKEHQSVRKEIEKVNAQLDDSVLICDTSGITPSTIISTCMKQKQKWGDDVDLSLIVIDYLQLLAPDKGNSKGDTRQQEVAKMSRQMKVLAKDLNVPILLLSQLSRDIEKRDMDIKGPKNSNQKAFNKPKLSDLRESGAIEQDADMVLFLYPLKSDDEENENTEQLEKRNIMLNIGKHRNGSCGDKQLVFVGKLMKFYEIEQAATDDLRKIGGTSRAMLDTDSELIDDIGNEAENIAIDDEEEFNNMVADLNISEE